MRLLGIQTHRHEGVEIKISYFYVFNATFKQGVHRFLPRTGDTLRANITVELIFYLQ